MKEIKLSRNQVAIVDDIDFEQLNKFKWSAKRSGSSKYSYGFYAARNVIENGTLRTQYMHRLILGIDGTNLLVDHIDGNKLNNTRNNLRIATRAENNRNIGMLSNNSSGFKGVTWNKKSKKFQARIKFNNKLIYLGSFSDAIEAAKLYDVKAVELFGEFANLNFK